MTPCVTRRGLLRAGGGLALGFVLVRPAAPGAAPEPTVDSWLRIGADGTVTLLTGKVELGQGVLTALAQIAADELDTPLDRLRVVSGDTALSPNEGGTTGSTSLPETGTAVRHAAAEARRVLIDLAAARWGGPATGLRTESGQVVSPDGRRLGYGELLQGAALRRRVSGDAPLRPAGERRHTGRPEPRLDLPAKIAGRPAFLHDQRPDEMVHGRVLRPPSRGAALVGLDEAPVRTMPGVLAVVRDGDFLGVVAEKEIQAVRAVEALAETCRWREAPSAEAHEGAYAWLKARPAAEFAIMRRGSPVAGARRMEAVYRRPYLMHGSIGPSAAIATYADGGCTIQSHSQTVFDTGPAIAQLLGLPRGAVRVQHMQGAGCYGHNGADDAAADAALLARAVPGRPVRLQWSRRDEHAWSPYGPAMQVELAADLGADGDIAGWRCDLWSTPHGQRPGGNAGNVLPGTLVARPFTGAIQPGSASLTSGPNRNSVPAYAIPNVQVTLHFVAESPVRVSALRSLGAHANVFAIESFMDELATAAGADPVAFRLRHLTDPRARAVIQAAADAFGWSRFERRPGRGRGLAYARYKNTDGYCAVCLEVAVDGEGEVRALRAVAAIDVGEVVNPDGLKNQIEGGLIQSLSWALKEEVRFAAGRVTSDNWSEYPILRFSEVPPIEVVVLDRPGQPFLGAGEAAQGPAGGALANAVFDAVGARVRTMPFSPERVRQAGHD